MSKKIIFSDKYRLTRAVLERRKTQTRRIIKNVDLIQYLNELEDDGELKGIRGNMAAQENADYYYISDDCQITHSRELFLKIDDNRYECGNYFKTKEEAEMYAEKIRELFKRKENG